MTKPQYLDLSDYNSKKALLGCHRSTVLPKRITDWGKQIKIMELSPKSESYFLGSISTCYLGYSYDTHVRERAASGGIVSSVIMYLLRTKQIDGALMCRTKCIDDKISFEVKIVTDPAEVLDYASSVYFNIPLIKYSNLIEEFGGKIAVVGLPCHIHALKKRMLSNETLANKVHICIGLFCGHNSKKELLDEVLKKKGISENNVQQIVFRRGHWRGEMAVSLKDGNVRSFPFQHFSIYQNLHFDSLKRCMHCVDHTAEFADISCGDVWMRYLKKDSIKHSIIITRTAKADRILRDMRNEGDIYLVKTDSSTVFRSQKRSLIYHKAIDARSKVGKFFGFNIACPPRYANTARWNEYFAAFIALLNVKISDNKLLRGVVFTLPRVILTPYLYVFKILTNF